MKSLLIALCALTCAAQVRPVLPADSANPNLPAHPIGSNDLLAVSVYDAPELSRSIRVASDGSIGFPMLKSRIKAQGYLPAQLESVIAETLSKEGILVEPLVTVTVAEYHSRPINVMGAVKTPLTFQAVGPTTLLDALGKAGGLSETAGSDILVTRGDGLELQRIRVKDLMDAAGPKLNIPLFGGEEIRIPAAGRAFVIGNVKKPGAYVLRESGAGTVMEMLAFAEGLSPYAGKHAYIYRRSPDGARNEMPVALDAILKRKHADVPVLPDDILYIPDNTGRRISMVALERVLAFGSTAGATALIYSGR